MNHSWIASSSNYISQHPTIPIVYYLLSHSCGEIVILSLKCVSSNFWPSPSFKAKFPRLVRIRGDRHLGAHLQCEQRVIAVCRRLQPPSPLLLIRRRSAIAKRDYLPL